MLFHNKLNTFFPACDCAYYHGNAEKIYKTLVLHKFITGTFASHSKVWMEYGGASSDNKPGGIQTFADFTREYDGHMSQRMYTYTDILLCPFIKHMPYLHIVCYVSRTTSKYKRELFGDNAYVLNNLLFYSCACCQARIKGKCSPQSK